MKTRRIKIPIYFGTLTVHLVGSIAELLDRYPLQGLREEGFRAVVFTNTRPAGVTSYVVAFIGQPDGATISHETVHVVNRIFSDRGVRLDEINDEPQAYLTGWVFGSIERTLQAWQKQG